MESSKTHLHQLIDSSQNEELLDLIGDLLEQDHQGGGIWSSLSKEQKERVLKAEESIVEYSKNSSHQTMVNKNKKWLK